MADPLAVGHRFDGLEIQRVLRRDSTSVEYAASKTSVGKRVRVKEYFPEGLVERRDSGEVRAGPAGSKALFDEALDYFLARFDTLGSIDHPAVVTVHACLRANGTGYAVLDDPDGAALETRLQDGGRFAAAGMAGVFAPIVEGLEAVHLAGLLHLEINLDSIVIREAGLPVLRGFGSAAVAAGGARGALSSRQPASAGLLTPGYAALEQYARHSRVGRWTDIYALAAVMYRCVTGDSPADAPGRVVQDGLVPAVRAARGLLDRKTLEGIDAALRLRPSERPQSLSGWRRQMPALEQRESTTADGGRFDARQFQQQAEATPAGAQTPSIPTRAVTSAGSGITGPRSARKPARAGAEYARISWAAPALAGAVIVAVLTWLDTGLLRSSQEPADGNFSRQESILQGEPAHAPQTKRPAATRPVGGRSAAKVVATPADDPQPAPTARKTAHDLPRQRQVAGPADLGAGRLLPGTEEGSGAGSGEDAEGSPLLARVGQNAGRDSGVARPASRMPEAAKDTVPRDGPSRGNLEAGPAAGNLIADGVPTPGAAAPDAHHPAQPQEGATRRTLTMDLFPAGAEVSFPGAADLTFRPGMTLPDGAYRVRVSSAGYRPETRNLDVSGDTHVKVHLVPEAHPLFMATMPSDAAVRFDEPGTSYAPGMMLPPGEYQVTVSLPGYRTWEGTVLHGTAPTHRQVTLSWEAVEFADPLSSGGAGPTMVRIAGGAYQMGCVTGRDCFTNELPLRDVDIEKPFALSKHEITHDDYNRFSAAAKRRRTGIAAGGGRGEHPVANVSWEDATMYVRWLTSETGRNYRLPSEAEWEYAARAHTRTAYSWGDAWEEGAANCQGCGSGQERRGTVRVGSLAPNPWGLHEMHGNVWEWASGCPDDPQENARMIIDASLADECANRVRRGGSWLHSPRRMRSASRDATLPDLRSPDTGFRVLLDIE